MLIQITNKCHEMCGHCLQCSNPDGKHMDETTFRNALKFAHFLGVSAYVITGGEPTEHPQFFQFCQYLDRFIQKDKLIAGFSITSNGMWFPDRKAEMEELAKLKNYVGMQVYTNPKWYKDAPFILDHAREINAIPKVQVDTDEIRSMQDLGRAKNNGQAQKEVADNRHYMSCLNGHLLFKQVNPTRKLKGLDHQPGIMCKPCIDYKGDVHLSESCNCPSFGNVNDDYMLDIFNNLRESKPCCKCALGQKFLNSTDVKIQVARNLLEL
mgnify:CR=1 FL=1